MEKEQGLKGYIRQNRAELFREIEDLIQNEDVTDIEWDGYYLWVTDLKKGCYCHNIRLNEEYVDNLAIRLANIMKVPFNRAYPILEANTEDLRISIWHESRCTKKSMAIRKIPTRLRFRHQDIVQAGYAPEALINLLENCVTAHCNIVIGGQPHAGKTELLKYLFRQMKRSVCMKTIRKSITVKLIRGKNVRSFLWMRSFHIHRLSERDCGIILTGHFCRSREDRRCWIC